MGIQRFEDLKVYPATMEATRSIYAVTKRFPPDELYGIVSQMRRAVVSIGCNIAEGFGRSSPRAKANYYNIAFASTEELKHLVRVSHLLNYLGHVDGEMLRLESISKMLRNLTQCVLGDA